MRFGLRARLRRTASLLMLLAMVAFVQQGTMIAASQAQASVGSMIDPAVTLRGSVHYHNSLARHVHTHGYGSLRHVHNTADTDHTGDENDAPLWSLGGTSAVISMIGIFLVSFKIVSADERPNVRLEGIEPERLNRPPSTPSIA